jgi:hypothetical protein
MLGTSQRRMRGVVSTRVLYPNQRQNTSRADFCVLSRLTGPAKKSARRPCSNPGRLEKWLSCSARMIAGALTKTNGPSVCA